MAKLASLKTKPTEVSVIDFIERVADEQQKKDSYTILGIMKKACGEEPRIWGTSIIGFGDKRFKSPTTGREVDWFRIGFSPRKANLSLYLIVDVKKHGEILKKLGKHTTGAGCLYIKRLSDIDMDVLTKMICDAAKK